MYMPQIRGLMAQSYAAMVNANNTNAYASIANANHTHPVDNSNNDSESENQIQIAEGYGVKPVFIKENDVRGPGANRFGWIEEDEVIDALVELVDLSHLKGVQRIYRAWRIYVDNIPDRVKLLSNGLSMRGRLVQVIPDNPNRPIYSPETTTRLVVSNVPLSIFDGQLIRKLELMGCKVISFWREKLRYKTRLTDCDNGRRIVIVEKLRKNIPKYIDISTYRGTIWYYGMPKEETQKKVCGKCKRDNHATHECTYQIVCNKCGEEGHKKDECPQFDEADGIQGDTDSDKEGSDDGSQHADEGEDQETGVEADADEDEEDTIQESGDEQIEGKQQDSNVKKPNDDKATVGGTQKNGETGKPRKSVLKGIKPKVDKTKKTAPEVKKGPIDRFVEAAKNVNEVLQTPKGKDRSTKDRTPPSLTKDKDSKKRDQKQKT